MPSIGTKRKRDIGVGPETTEKKRSARVTKVVLYPAKRDASKAPTVMTISHDGDNPTPNSTDTQPDPNPATPPLSTLASTIHNGNTGCHGDLERQQALSLIDAAATARDSTPFERRVWRLLVQIPRGHVSTYGALAAHLASSPRAVGNALRRNPFAPLVPCHRVVATGGGLGGFKGKVARRDGEGDTLREKRALLKGEGVGLDVAGGRVVGTPWDAFVG
ncbi:hypothetical protein RB601_008518 [Gaeumannomyces tritici]